MFEAKWYMGSEAVCTLEKVNIRVLPSDEYAVQLFVTEKDDGSMIAVGTICPDMQTGDVCISRITLMPKYAGTIYNELVLRMLLFKTQQMQNTKIYMWADEEEQKLLVPFGFASNGEKNDESGKPLIKMQVKTADIVWPSQCKH
ncbi:MAG: hypothetical protein IJO48_00535 [Clostridia bacterium]|nr:hypothetical protein [Clostridia bacterium]